MRKVPLVTGEIYHIFNRGVDKRTTFEDLDDIERFIKSVEAFNTPVAIGSIYEYFYEKKHPSANFGHRMSKKVKDERLVEIIAYCVNPNHYHLLLRQIKDHGIEKLMQKVGNGYTKYFNNKYQRSGALFQGKFKSVHIEDNTQLLHVSAYVNLNNYFKGKKSKISCSSWEEYNENQSKNICEKGIIVDQFKNKKEYIEFARSSLDDILRRKEFDEVFGHPMSKK